MLREAHLHAYLLELRARLPGRFGREPLDRLLASLDQPLAGLDADAVLAITERTERIARRLGFRDTCLFRAIARRTALRATGHPACLVLGLRRDVADTEGHAWVELHGAVVSEELEHDFEITFRERLG